MPAEQTSQHPIHDTTLDQRQEIERAYLQRVRDECRYLDSEGVDQRRAELSEVFVMLEAVPSRRRKSESDVAPVPQRAEETGREEQSTEHAGPGESQRHAKTPSLSRTPVPLTQALKQHSHLVILGEPGTGKTTLLQFAALCFASNGWTTERLELDETRLPIRIALKTYDGVERLDRFIVQQLDRSYVPTEMGHAWLAQGRLAILLDGLDEVGEGNRSVVLTAVQRFAATQEGSISRIVLTSRLAGYAGTTDFGQYTIKPLIGTDDARSYVAGWLHALRGTPPEAALIDAEMLLNSVHQQPGLRRVLTNPLLLRLAVAVFAETGQFAVNRVELYRRYVEEVLWRRAQSRSDCSWSQIEVKAALETIAWTLHTQGPQTASSLRKVVESDESEIKDGTGLVAYLQEPLGMLGVFGFDQGEVMGFRHLSFQEYFVARRLYRAWIENPMQAWRFLKPRLHHPAWLEPILLFAGQLDQPHATQLVRYIWEKADSPDELLLHRDLLLAASILGEGAQVERYWAEMLIAHLLGLFADADVKSLSGIWPFRAVRRWWGRKMYRHERLGRFSSLQQRIDEVLAKVGLHWPQQVTAPLERILATPLDGTAYDPEWRELPHRYQDEQDYDLRSRAAAILADLQRGDILLKALATKDARIPATWALLRLKLIDDETLGGIISLASSRDHHIRQAVAWLLSVDDGEAAIDALFRLADDEDDTVKQYAFVQLGQLRRHQLVPEVALMYFRALAAESDGDGITSLANVVLEGLDDLLRVDGLPFTHISAFGRLSKALHRKEGPLWEGVRILLVEGPKSAKAVENLIATVTTTDSDYPYYRNEETTEASLALLAIFGTVSSETLEQVMGAALTIWEARNWIPPTPRNTIVKLAESRPDEVLTWIQQHQQTATTVEAVGALAQHGHSKADDVLLELLQHQEPVIRWTAITELKSVEATPKITAAIRQRLHDEDRTVSETAIEAIIALVDHEPETRTFLLDHLDECRDDPYLYRKLFLNYDIVTPEIVTYLMDWYVGAWDDLAGGSTDYQGTVKVLHERMPVEVRTSLLQAITAQEPSRDTWEAQDNLWDRSRAAQIVGYIGAYSEEAEIVLLATLKEVGGPRRMPAWALGRICKYEPSDTVVSSLIETLNSQQRLLQVQLESQQTADELDDVLMDHLIQALGCAGRGHPEAIALLTEFLEQGSKSRLRQAAAMALLQLGRHSPAVVGALPGLWKAKPIHRPMGYTYALAEEETEAAIWRLAQEQPGEFRTSLIEAHRAGSMQAAEILLDTMGTHLDLITLNDLTMTLHGQLANAYNDRWGSHFVYTKLERVAALATVAEVSALSDNPPLFVLDKKKSKTFAALPIIVASILIVLSGFAVNLLSDQIRSVFHGPVLLAVAIVIFLAGASASVWLALQQNK